MSTCKVCGREYDLICATCFNKKREETLLSEMDKAGLTLPKLIKRLASQVEKDKFQALNKAINLLVEPTTRVEVTGEGGGPIEIAEAKGRITDIFARINARLAEGEVNSGVEPGGTEGDTGGVGGAV
jgi:hypothetical protein